MLARCDHLAVSSNSTATEISGQLDNAKVAMQKGDLLESEDTLALVEPGIFHAAGGGEGGSRFNSEVLTKETTPGEPAKSDSFGYF
jgi:hypothetical protein